MVKRHFGEIAGYGPGTEFKNRQHLHEAGVHKPTQAGISGSAKEGADSIVLSGGYEDDEDLGDVIIYTGEGGRNESTQHQEEDQQLKRKNLALAKSCLESLPVRLIRGGKHKSPYYSPSQGYRYRYEGLYFVEDYWREKGKDNYYVWRFRLRKAHIIEQNNDASISESIHEPKRRLCTQQKIVRNPQIAQEVKEIYHHKCQVCGLAIKIRSGLYAEAAHIKPLGRPHNGPDRLANLLCLCPNHHVMFDNGVFCIQDDFTLKGDGMDGKLRINRKHKILLEFIRYHRDYYFVD